ncbi:hypothetical protein Poli38472_004136 [Pythium oligandrum]|uniref:Mitochondrial GTPase 1 n=1 Tax=Pythium oligandrum TaxID=41045 RepID=A0A8K1CPI7_PYTOL|nr:hypothetical protein Poli38472_004136 [Pythium oligandrum]|eukprot:TMW66371.1 hypothetical protein Poli38472_004136 [Pythium oligandrum]
MNSRKWFSQRSRSDVTDAVHKHAQNSRNSKVSSMRKSETLRKGVNLIRPKRRKRQYFSPKASGESFREWVERNLEESYAALLFDAAMAVLSVFMVLFYVAVNWDHLVVKNEPWVEAVDFYLNLLFTLEYLMRMYAAHERIDYFVHPQRIIELLVLLPSWVDYMTIHLDETLMASGSIDVIRGMRPLRILRTYRLLEFTKSSLQRQVIAGTLTIISITLSTAGILQVIENCDVECHTTARMCHCQSLSYLDFLYFVVVSISTLGYGDIAPVSVAGKFLISFIILLTFVLVPIQVNRIATIISSHTDYSSAYTEYKQHPHVILTGHIDVEMLTTFLSQFFHSSNLNWNEKIVILNPSPPSAEMKKMLNSVENKVKYVVGSPMLDEDLDRAVVHGASACYVLVNRNATRPQYADQCTTLITIALRRGNPACPIYAQVLNAQNSSTILKMGATDVLVEGLMKSSILGRSCEVYGLPTVLRSLLSQAQAEMDRALSPVQWQKPYLHGYMHGIYVVDIPRTFSGLTFGDLIRFLYEKTPVIPLAMLTDEGVQFIDMEFKLGGTADPNLCCKVYAIAMGHKAIGKIAQIPPEQILSYRKNLRRKAKSAMDLMSDEEIAVAQKKIKPALGDEIEQIRQSMIKMYSWATRHSFEDTGIDYEEFTTVGAPPAVSKHIIVCGVPQDTFQFLKTIREAAMSEDNPGSPPIVFLAPQLISEDDYAKIRCFPQVYFVLGSPVNFADLKRTRIESAVSVIILTRTTRAMYTDPNMVDADAITTLRFIVEISQRTRMPNLVVELDRPSNVKLLSSLANDRRSSATYTLPSIVSRQISYRTARRGSVRRESSMGMAEEVSIRDPTASLALEEFVAAGRVYMNSILDSLLSECYRKEWINQFIFILVNGRPDDPFQRRLFQVEVPDELVSLHFIDCFRKLLDMTSCVCIGLWRPERGVILPHPCVFVCPPPDLQVEPHDQLYLVGRPITFEDAQQIWANVSHQWPRHQSGIARKAAKHLTTMSAFRSKFLYPSKINWFPGHMANARRQMVAQLDSVDVLIEVRDARIPWSSANPVLEETFGKTKPRLIVFNKSDLANSNMQKRIEDQCRAKNVPCLFTSVTKGRKIQSILQWCNASSGAQFKKTAGTMVMVVGVPNVGKSSIINEFRRLSSSQKLSKGKKRAAVGPTPGVTVRNDIIKVNDKPAIYVVDTPGVMLPNVESVETGMRLALTGAIKDDIIGKDVIADYMLFKLNQVNSTRYVDALKLPGPTDDIQEVFQHSYKYCSALGKEPDVQKQLAAEFLLKEFRRGAFGQFTLDSVDPVAAKATREGPEEDQPLEN